MISINLGTTRTVGLVYAIGKPDRAWNHDGAEPIEVSVELIGEVRDGEPPAPPVFDRGITAYPHIGAIAHRIRTRDLQAVYDLAGRHSVTIGKLSQDETIDASIAIDDTLARHFAVVGTTGVGKSTAVSLLLRKAIEARPDLRVLILDPHNEFAASLPEYSVTDRFQHARPAVLDVPAGGIRRGAVSRPRDGAGGGRRAARPHPGGQEPLPQPGSRQRSCAAAAMR